MCNEGAGIICECVLLYSGKINYTFVRVGRRIGEAPRFLVII